MKKTNLIYVFAAFILVMASCKKDFLEEKKDYSGTNEDVFKDPLLAQAYVDYIYGLFLPANNAESFTWNLATNNSDFTKTTEEYAGETNWNKEWAKISYTQAHDLGYFGPRLSSSIGNNTWTRMKQINIFLAEVDKYGLPEDTRNKLKGQLYFWRAWQYFDLVRLYGGVPLVLVPQNPILSSGDNTEVQRSKTSECIEQICADLDKAQELLPPSWSSSDWGRITKGAAAAYKGRVLLTWASPLFNPTDDIARWERAYQANKVAKTLLEENGYNKLDLSGDLTGGKTWGDMFLKEVNNPEAVLVYGFNNASAATTTKNNGWEQATRSKEILGSGSASPTKEMLDAFPMKDGKPIGSSTYAYDQSMFYKNRDPRFYKTFVYNGAIWPYKENQNYKQWTYVWKKTSSATGYNATTETKGANSSGIYLCKANNPQASNANGNFQQSGTDYMEMRFAEVILNLAESAIGAGHPDQEAKDLIISIRKRAGVENLDGSYGLAAVTGRDPLFAAVLNERKVEFAYEGKRFFDLRRWKLFEEGSTTAARLGITPLNGTRRHGLYVSVKTSTGADYSGSADPMIKPANGNAPVIDRDPSTYPTGVSNYSQYVDYLYTNYFKVSVKDDLDKTSGNWKFKWYPEYYYFGINETALTATPYLLQTKGWDGLNGQGTFDPLQ